MRLVEDRFDRNTQKVKNKFPNSLQIKKLKMESFRACAQMIAAGDCSKYDLIYIDGSHKSCDVLSDAIMSFPLARPGALIIFDDYLWDFGFKKTGSPLNAPKIGIDAFTSNFADSVEIIHGLPSYQLYLRKL